jgi:transcriptional regulator with XRE-family HTH domain
MPGDEERKQEAALRFGENLRAARERREVSQEGLAQSMNGRGHSWYASTVWKIEHGERTVGFYEAEDLAGILRVTTDRFTWATPEAAAVMLMSGTTGRLREAWREVADAAARLHAATAAAEQSVAENRDSKYERVRAAARGLGEELEGATLEAALAEAEALWQRTKRGEA